MNYYERHIGDYARDTAHLTILEHGVYTILLDRYYATESPIPKDQAHRVSRARSDEERAAVDSVLSEFFTLEDGAYRNRRADEEIARARVKIESNRVNGRKGGRPKKLNPNETQVEPNGNPTETQRKPNGFDPDNPNVTQVEPNVNPNKSPPDTRHQTPDTSRLKSIEQQAARFGDFWNAYPNKKGRADALKAWKRKKLDAIADQIIADVKERSCKDRQWLAGYIPHGSTYVNAEGWQDAIELPKQRQTTNGYTPLPGEV